jgi:hypothetical protein
MIPFRKPKHEETTLDDLFWFFVLADAVKTWEEVVLHWTKVQQVIWRNLLFIRCRMLRGGRRRPSLQTLPTVHTERPSAIKAMLQRLDTLDRGYLQRGSEVHAHARLDTTRLPHKQVEPAVLPSGCPRSDLAIRTDVRTLADSKG